MIPDKIKSRKHILFLMKEIVVFAYNFPHRKTQDFLFHLFACGIKINHVFAADAVKLDIPPSEVRTKVRHCTPLHPSDVAKSIGAQYHQVPHQGSQINALIEEINPIPFLSFPFI